MTARRAGGLRPRAGAAVIALVGLVGACASEAVLSVDPQLVEAIDWYTGVTGQVDDARARELLEEAAADQDPISVMWKARVYSRGRMGFPQDEDEARRLAASVIGDVERAAADGIVEAEFLMGTAYDEGLGKEENADSATAWHRRAASAGYVLGQHNLGNAYAAGRGVPRNPALAVEWWTLAASKGDAVTQLRLGEAYESGTGVTADMAEALRWYGMAAQAGNREAQEALARLAAANTDGGDSEGS